MQEEVMTVVNTEDCSFRGCTGPQGTEGTNPGRWLSGNSLTSSSLLNAREFTHTHTVQTPDEHKHGSCWSQCWGCGLVWLYPKPSYVMGIQDCRFSFCLVPDDVFAEDKTDHGFPPVRHHETSSSSVRVFHHRHPACVSFSHREYKNM